MKDVYNEDPILHEPEIPEEKLFMQCLIDNANELFVYVANCTDNNKLCSFILRGQIHTMQVFLTRKEVDEVINALNLVKEEMVI